MADLPATIPEADSYRELDMFNAHASVPNFAEALTGLQSAVRAMHADDILFEIDASDNRLHVRLRAYRRSSG